MFHNKHTNARESLPHSRPRPRPRAGAVWDPGCACCWDSLASFLAPRRRRYILVVVETVQARHVQDPNDCVCHLATGSEGPNSSCTALNYLVDVSHVKYKLSAR